MRKILRFVSFLTFISVWIFSAFPKVWERPKIPPEIQKAQAALSMSFIGSVEGSAANGADVTLNLSGLGLQEGDLVIVAYAVGDNDNTDFNMAVSSPTDYTEVADLFSNDTYEANLGVYWKIMGATPDTSVTVTGQGGTDAAVSAVAMAFRGVDPTTPMDVTPTTATALNTMHPNPPAINYASTGVWTVIAGASGHALNLANTNNPYTFPAGYTTNNVQRPENDTSDITVGLGYKTTPANPEDPAALTHSGTDSTGYAWAAVTLALRPKVVSFNQSAYRFFNNADSTDVGLPLALQDTAATLSSSGQAFRLRMLLHIGTNTLLSNEQSFKLQFAQRGADNQCDTAFSGETYSDVTAATAIAYNDNATPVDGTALTANANDPTHGADTIVSQTYEELNNFTNSVAAIPSGQDGKWDFSLKDNGAPANTTFCFRVVKSDGTLLNTYTVIPQVTTAVSATISVAVSDGSVAYGIIPANTSKSTCTSELNDAQTVTNDGNVTENFLIRGQNSANWTLGSTPGSDVYAHRFATSTCATWPGGTALTTADQTMATGITPNATTTLNLQITTPNSSSVYTQQAVDIIITATQQ